MTLASSPVRRSLFFGVVGCLLAWLWYGYYGWQVVLEAYEGRLPGFRDAPPKLAGVAWEPFLEAVHQAFFLWAGAALLVFLALFFLAHWRVMPKLVRGLVVFAAASALVLPLLLYLTGTPFDQLSLIETRKLLLGWEADDSWLPMFRALTHLFEDGRPLYTIVFFEQHTKFQYPPTSLLVVAVLKVLAPPDAYVNVTQFALVGIAEVFSLLFFFLTAVFSGRIFQFTLRHLARDQAPAMRSGRLATALVIGALAATYYPVASSYASGQIQTWINGLFAVMFWCWITRDYRPAGVALGVICLLKPQYAILILWGLTRGNRTFVASAVVTAAVGLAISVLAFGWVHHADYLPVLGFLSKHGEAFYPNQSVNGLLNRWFLNGDSLTFDFHGFPPFHPAVYAGTMAASALILALALWRPARRAGGPEDFAFAAVAATLASPIAWFHHYGILLPIYCYLLPRLWSRRVAGRWTLPLLGLSYVLTSHQFTIANRFAGQPGWNLLQSWMFFGALIVFGLLWRLRERQAGSRRAV